MPDIRIGELSRRTGTNPSAIRYYEQIGLLPAAPRRDGNAQRRYGEDDVGRLTMIRRARDFGFSIEQVRTLVGLIDDDGRPCFEARDLAQDHLHAVRAKLKELKALERSIADFVATCDVACAGGPGPDCEVLKDMQRPRSQGRKEGEQ